MADSKISALTSQTGAGTDTTADLLVIVDTSAATTKKIIPDELAIAIGIPCATQAQQQTATTSTATVRPSVQQYHPSATKAWGSVATPTTVQVSYPATASVSKSATGIYVVTPGVTTTATTYGLQITVLEGASAIASRISGRTVSTFTVQFFDTSNSGVAIDPSGFTYDIKGTLV